MPTATPHTALAQPLTLHLSQQFALSDVATAQALAFLPRSTVRAWVNRTLAAGLKALKLAKKVHTAQITLRWVAGAEGRALNHAHRGQGVDKDYATNVLTFAYGVDDKTLSADIVLCWPVVLKEAKTQGKSTRHHAAHLIVHGTLHALGFDHENEADAAVMETLEIKILSQLNISNPY